MSDQTPARPDFVDVYADKAGEFRWRRVAPNGRNVSDSGEGYEDEDYTIQRALKLNPGCVLRVLDAPPDES